MATSLINSPRDVELGPPPSPSPASLGTQYKEEKHALSSMDSFTRQESEKPPAFPASATQPFSFNPKTWTVKMRILASTGLFLVLAAIATAIAVPLSHNSTAQHTTKPATPLFVNPPSTALIASNAPLRIMPLGASITYGWLSTDGNGYREDLLGLFQRGGNTEVTYVGSRHNGTMKDNAVEGWPGYRIDQIWAKANVSVPRDQPNVVLLNAGTNDCVQNWNLNATTKQSTVDPALTASPSDNVGTRMRALVDDVFAWAPNATVVMSTLVYNKNPRVMKRVDVANAQFRSVAAALQAAGKRVVLADMTVAAGGPNATTMADSTHPNDVGYALMANKWYEAVTEAGSKGLIVN